MFTRSRGFTLIELLIVVAIIAILAAIAVPNFLEAQTRSKVGRAQSDLRTLATALESYKVDWNRYPADWVVDRVIVGTSSLISEGFIPPRISTPVAYLSSASLPDPFLLANRGGVPLDPLYWPAGNLFYQSVQHSMRAANHPAFAVPNNTVREYAAQLPRPGSYQQAKQGAGWAARNWHENYGLWKAGSIGPIQAYNGGDNTYDPTNGTISSGDIYRTQKNPIGSTN